MARYRKRLFDDSAPSLFDATDAFDAPVVPDEHAESDGSELSGVAEVPDYDDAATDSLDDMALGEVPQGAHRLQFISFGSGSSGNSAYIGDDTQGLLIDAGIDGKIVTDTLARYAIPMSRIKGVLITHDHGDHVRYLYSILRRNKTIPLYCTPRVLNGMLRRHSMSRRVKDYHHAIYKEIEFTVGTMRITPFEVLHDGSDNVGFSITVGEQTFVVATDLGTVTDRARHYISQANHLMIEANYDREMLVTGSRPEYLKARILGDHGHLDNEDTARLLAEVYTPRLRNIFLCHLSEDNNTPELAVRVVTDALRQRVAHIGDATNTLQSRRAPLQLTALTRFVPTPLYTLTIPEV